MVSLIWSSWSHTESWGEGMDSAVALSALCAADVEVLASWADDEILCAHAGWVASRSSVRDFWQRQLQHPPERLIRLGAKLDGVLVGHIDLHGDGEQERELGYLIGPSDRWGQGLGGRIAAAGLGYAFTELELRSVWAEAVVANQPSVRILRSCGMRETGDGAPEAFLGVASRYLQFRITRSEWARLNSAD